MLSISEFEIFWYVCVFILGWRVTKYAVLASKSSFICAGLKGNDMGRDPRPVVRFLLHFKKSYIYQCYFLQVAESLGLVSAVVFLVLSVIRLPLFKDVEDLLLLTGALFTITCSVFLGFIDDVLNLKWRHKLWAPGNNQQKMRRQFSTFVQTMHLFFKLNSTFFM